MEKHGLLVESLGKISILTKISLLLQYGKLFQTLGGRR